MDISLFFYPCHMLTDFLKPHCSSNLPNRIRIRRLHPDFQLDQSRTHLPDQSDFLIIQQIRRNFKVKIRDSIVMLLNIFPDCHSMVMFTVKCTIHELHLRNLMIQEKLQFIKH